MPTGSHAHEFHGLPGELVARIFEDLDATDLVCHLFHAIVRDTAVLQYHIELTVAGVEENGAANKLTVSERLSELKTIQESWATLRFRKRQTISLPIVSEDSWKLSGGFIVYGVPTSADGPVRGLSFVELPSSSAVCDTPRRAWEHGEMGLDIVDFAIDPTQDLAVLIADPTDADGVQRIHLREMSTGESHPRAADSVLSCVPEATTINYSIQIMGEFLAVLFSPGEMGQLFVIWSWLTGKLVAELKVDDDECGVESFSFLSSRHIVVSRIRSDPKTPALQVYDFLVQRPIDSLTQYPELVRSFDLPELHEDVQVCHVETYSDPPPQCHPLPSDTGALFRTASGARILTISMTILQSQGSLCKFDLFFHSSTLLNGIEDGQIPEEFGINVPWETWGPQNSRMLQERSSNDLTYHGTRRVQLESYMALKGGTELRIIRALDFNPLALHRKYAPKQGGDDDKWMGFHRDVYPASRPTQMTAINVFKYSVKTTLPFSAVYTNESFDYDTIMMDEECIVGIFQPQAQTPNGRTLNFEFLCL